MVHGPQDHGTALKGDQNLSIGLKLLLFRGERIAPHIEKLCAKKPYTIGILGPGQVIRIGGGNIQLHLDPGLRPV